MVVAHHAAQAYGPTGGIWVVTDSFKADWLKHFFFVNASFMMGLYFFISGYIMAFSIRKKTTIAFMSDRFKRLGIPFLFFTLLVFLPFNYIFSHSKANVFIFFADSYLHKPPIATSHLWFFASLLAYSIIYTIIFHNWFFAFSKKSKSFTVGHIIIFTATIAILSALIRLKYPIDTWKTWLIPVEPAHLPQYFLLFLCGTYFNHANWLAKLQSKHALFFFTAAVLSYMVQPQLPENVKDYWLTKSVFESVMCVGLSLGLLTFFKRYANSTQSFTSKLSANAYGIYLVHLFIVILLQFGLLQTNMNANLKFLAVTFAAIILSLLLSMFIRKNKQIKEII